METKINVVYPYSSTSDNFEKFLVACEAFPNAAKEADLTLITGASTKEDRFADHKLRAGKLFNEIHVIRKLVEEPTNVATNTRFLAHAFTTCWPQLCSMPHDEFIMMSPFDIPKEDDWVHIAIHMLRKSRKNILACGVTTPNGPAISTGSIIYNQAFYDAGSGYKVHRAVDDVHKLLEWPLKASGTVFTPDESPFKKWNTAPKVKPVEPIKTVDPVRDHNPDGTFTADDPATPEINEAYKPDAQPVKDADPIKDDIPIPAKKKAAKKKASTAE